MSPLNSNLIELQINETLKQIDGYFFLNLNNFEFSKSQNPLPCLKTSPCFNQTLKTHFSFSNNNILIILYQ